MYLMTSQKNVHLQLLGQVVLCCSAFLLLSLSSFSICHLSLLYYLGTYFDVLFVVLPSFLNSFLLLFDTFDSLPILSTPSDSL